VFYFCINEKDLPHNNCVDIAISAWHYLFPDLMDKRIVVNAGTKVQ
jgi:hypothetical protein